MNHKKMRFLKKLSLGLMTALVLVVLAGSLTARAEGFAPGQEVGSLFDPPPRAIHALTSFEGGLYFVSGQLYSIKPGGQPRIQGLADYFGQTARNNYDDLAFVQDESRLGLLDRQTGTLVFLDLTADLPVPGRAIRLDWADYTTDSGYYVQVDAPVSYALAGDILYALDRRGAPLTRFDLSTGKKLEPVKTAALSLLPYKDQKLLLVQTAHADEDAPGQFVLSVYEPDKDKARVLRPIQAEAEVFTALGSSFYDFMTDTLLLSLKDTVFIYPGLGDGQPCATLPRNDGILETVPIAGLPGALVAMADRQKVYIKSADPDAYANKTPLTLLLSADNIRGLNEAMSLVDSVKLTTREMSMSPLEFAQMMVNGAEEDLLWVKLSRVDFMSLMKKGYALDLSDSPQLLDQHEKLYPVIRKAVSYGGGVFALPMTAYGTVLLGEDSFVFDEDMKPTLHSLSDLLDYVETWPDVFGEEHPEMLPFGNSDTRHELYQMVLQTYVDGYLGSGQSLAFDTQLLRELLMRTEALDLEALDQHRSEEYGMPAVFPNEWLMFLHQFSGDGRDSCDYYPFLLSPGEGLPASLPLEVTCVFINAKTRHPEAALAFLEALALSRGDDDRILMNRNDNQPVENPHYDQALAEHQALMARRRAELNGMKGAQRTETEDWLKRAAGYYEELKLSQRYTISPEQIAAYREMAENAYVRQYSEEYQGAREALEILPQYIDGSIAMDMYIKEIEGRLNLIRTENQ